MNCAVNLESRDRIYHKVADMNYLLYSLRRTIRNLTRPQLIICMPSMSKQLPFIHVVVIYHRPIINTLVVRIIIILLLIYVGRTKSIHRKESVNYVGRPTTQAINLI